MESHQHSTSRDAEGPPSIAELLLARCDERGASAAIAEVLGTPAELAVLAALRLRGRAAWEAVGFALRAAGATTREIDALRSAVRAARPAGDRASALAASPVVRVREVLPDAPVGDDVVVPPAYQLDEHGVYRVIGDGRITVAPAPVIIEARLCDVEGTRELVRLAWRRGRRWQSADVDRGVVADTRRIVQLADHGLSVTSSTARLLVDYVAASEATNLHRLPVEQVTSHLGYVDGDRAYVWGREVITADGAPSAPISIAVPTPATSSSPRDTTRRARSPHGATL